MASQNELPPRTDENKAEHLGDGVYAYWDGMHIWLRTQRDDGIHEVALEFSVYQVLIGYAARAAGWTITGAGR